MKMFKVFWEILIWKISKCFEEFFWQSLWLLRLRHVIIVHEWKYCHFTVLELYLVNIRCERYIGGNKTKLWSYRESYLYPKSLNTYAIRDTYIQNLIWNSKWIKVIKSEFIVCKEMVNMLLVASINY